MTGDRKIDQIAENKQLMFDFGAVIAAIPALGRRIFWSVRLATTRSEAGEGP